VSEREQTRRRRVEPREGAVAPRRRRRAKDDDFNRRSREREEAVRVRRRSRTGVGTSTPPRMPTSPRTPLPRHRPSSSRPRLQRHPDVSTTAALFLFPPSLIPSLFGTGGVGVRRRVSLPGCRPSSRSTAAPRLSGALGPSMPPGPLSPCEDHL
jgi:hypothetical protein